MSGQKVFGGRSLGKRNWLLRLGNRNLLSSSTADAVPLLRWRRLNVSGQKVFGILNPVLWTVGDAGPYNVLFVA